MNNHTKHQKGAVLLIVLLLIVVGGAAIAVRGYGGSEQGQQRRDAYTRYALLQAKEALIARAVADANRPGSLPCPDLDNDGSAEMFVGNHCTFYLGRFPGKTMRLPNYRDGSGETIWYAFDPQFRDHPSAMPLTSALSGSLTITGDTPYEQVIAVVIAPNFAFADQPRSAATSEHVSLYLEGENNSDDHTRFRAAPLSEQTNDRVLAITHGELMGAVTARVAADVAAVLSAQANFPLTLDSIDSSDIAYWEANWSTAVDSYTRTTSTSATIAFVGCSILYTLVQGQKPLRSQTRC
ncbi:hypothetical protein [Chrysiogenes arsenatis]|uniref:hypothetical protein n=1 Tax=Chrysiogenes arsenatis TaxID=309797 RepID=UPI0004881785|nr:hypothetical protein [Chrysiogenes arsenatis]